MSVASTKFLYEYLNSNAPVGAEVSGQKVWLRYIKPYIDEYFVDTYGTAVGVINPKAPYKVVIEAHADEISWYVNHITKEGYMYVICNGGSDYQVAPSMKAKIHTDQGMIPAVFGWPAIHVRKSKEKLLPNVETVVLDGGFSSKEEVLKKGINIGTVVTFDRELSMLNNRFWAGRALDNRIGGFAIAEVARMLQEHKTKLPFGLYIVNAVQEEIGNRGAKMIAERIGPHVALVTDVCHCTHSPHYNKKKQGDIVGGKGPVIDTAPSVHPNVHKMLIEVAQQQKINFQRSASQYYTGTDTEAFAYTRNGIPTALLSMPLKYMHTTVEMVHQEDVQNLINWIYQFLRQLEAGHCFDIKIDV